MIPPPKLIYVDVDGTLIVHGLLNVRLVEWLRHRQAAGFTLHLWSMRGEVCAREQATLHGVDHLFTHILGKPGFIVDDKGWSWIKWARPLFPLPRDEVVSGE